MQKVDRLLAPHRPHRSGALALLASAAALLLGNACVVGPYNDYNIGSAHSTFTVSGFGQYPSSQIVIEAKNKKTNVWEQIGTTTTAASAIVNGNTYPGTNTPDLYYYSKANVAVSLVSKPTTWCRWDSTCAINRFSTAELRVRELSAQGELQLYTGEESSQACVQARLGEGDDFYAASYECGYDTNTLRLRQGG